MRIVHLTSVHPSDDSRIFHKMCRSLQENGIDTVLIAPGTVEKNVDGVRVVPVQKASKRLSRALLTGSRVYRLALQERADIYHFHDPELIPWGLLLRSRGRHVVMDVHEDLPKQIQHKVWIPRRFRRFAGWAVGVLLSWSAKRFDLVVTATAPIANNFRNAKVRVVQNFPVLREFPELVSDYDERVMNVAYVGGISTARGVLDLLDVLVLLRGRDVRLLLAGPIHEQGLEEKLRAHPGWSSVEYLGWQSREGVRELLQRSRVGVVTLHPTPNHLESQPIKLYEYMAAGLPVVASNFPAWEAIVAGRRCGVVVDPLQMQAVAAAVLYLLDNPETAREMGARGRAAVLDTYNWNSEVTGLIQAYEEVIHSPS